MPHKTKKEKIIADYRKRLKLFQEQHQGIQPLTAEPAPSPAPAKNVQEPKRRKIEETEEDAHITGYFKKDFKKSLILITIVITLEISLYFARIIHIK